MPFKNPVQRKLYAREYYREYMRKRRAETRSTDVFDLEQFLNDISHCPECKAHPAVFLTSGKIPVCKEHWNILADELVEWTEEGKFKVYIVKI